MTFFSTPITGDALHYPLGRIDLRLEKVELGKQKFPVGGSTGE